PAPTTITWTAPAAIVHGTALSSTQLNATVTPTVPGTFVYTPAEGAGLDPGTQTLSVTFTPTSGNYAATTSTTTITVRNGTVTITWPAPADITYRTALSGTPRSATATIPGTFVYAPAAGAVLNAGAGQTLSVTFTPTDTASYATTTATTTINVVKAAPAMTWATPAEITYGTALSAPQLTATATVPGTFAYTPTAGTVLNAGSSQTLSVTF